MSLLYTSAHIPFTMGAGLLHPLREMQWKSYDSKQDHLTLSQAELQIIWSVPQRNHNIPFLGEAWNPNRIIHMKVYNRLLNSVYVLIITV